MRSVGDIADVLSDRLTGLDNLVLQQQAFVQKVAARSPHLGSSGSVRDVLASTLGGFLGRLRVFASLNERVVHLMLHASALTVSTTVFPALASVSAAFAAALAAASLAATAPSAT